MITGEIKEKEGVNENQKGPDSEELKKRKLVHANAVLAKKLESVIGGIASAATNSHGVSQPAGDTRILAAILSLPAPCNHW